MSDARKLQIIMWLLVFLLVVKLITLVIKYG